MITFNKRGLVRARGVRAPRHLVALHAVVDRDLGNEIGALTSSPVWKR